MAGERRVSVTIRIDKEVLNELQRLSKSSGLSLNAAINQLLAKETHWRMHSASAGFLYFPRSIISDLASNVSEQLILETAQKYASEEAKEAIVMVRANFSFRATLEWLETWMEISGIAYRHEHMANSHILVLGLHMGKKVSLLVA